MHTPSKRLTVIIFMSLSSKYNFFKFNTDYIVVDNLKYWKIQISLRKSKFTKMKLNEYQSFKILNILIF